MSRPEKLAFILGSLTLVFMYGFGAAAFGWPPGDHVYRAFRQGVRIFSNPEYVVDRVYDWSGARVHEEAAMQDGLTLVVSTWGLDGESSSHVRLVDKRGRVLHQWRIPEPTRLFSTDPKTPSPGLIAARGVHGTYLFPNGNLLANWEYTGTVLLDACSRVLWKVERRNHHSIARADDGSFWIPTTNVVDDPRSDLFPDGFPAVEGPIANDGFMQVREDGAIVHEYHVLDILYKNNLQRHLRKGTAKEGDPLHLNDVEPLSARMADEYPLFEAGDLMLSLRNPELVLIVDPATLEVKWHTSEPFIQQHDPDFLGNGWIGVFDNNRDDTERGTVLGGSRIVAVQPHTDSVKVLYPAKGHGRFYSHIMGKFQQLENGNLLITEAQAGRVFEVTSEGRTVWDWARAPLDEDHTVEVSEGTRYPFSLQQVEAWPCTRTGSLPQTEEETID